MRTLHQQSFYRDVFGLTDDQIDGIAIGVPSRVYLHATPDRAHFPLAKMPDEATMTRFAVQAAQRTLD